MNDPWRVKYWGDGDPPATDARDDLRALIFVVGWALIAGILIAWAVVAWHGLFA